MARGFKVFKRIRNTISRLFQCKPKFNPFEDTSEDYKLDIKNMSEEELEGLITEQIEEAERYRELYLKGIQLIRDGHRTVDETDMIQQDDLVAGETSDMSEKIVSKEHDQQDTQDDVEETWIRMTRYGCEVTVHLKELKQ